MTWIMFNMVKSVEGAKKLNMFFIFWIEILFDDSFGRGVAAYFLCQVSNSGDV